MSESQSALTLPQGLPPLSLPAGDDPFVLLMAAVKGGVGKSALAINLAVTAAQNGLSTVIIDADSVDEQLSCLRWFETRDATYSANPKVIRASISKVEDAVAWAKAKRFDLVVIDTGGRDLPALPRLLDLADFMMTPAQPSPLDLRATAPIRRVWPTSATPASIVLNGVGRENSGRARYYRDRHADEGKIMNLIVSRRVQYIDAIAKGQGVSEYLPGGAGDIEMRNLLNAIFAASERGGVA